MGWLPDPVERLLDVALVGELTVVGRNGRPVTHPLIPLYDGDHIYLHSSTLFSKKLEHIKANDPDCVAVASHGRGLSRLIVGSVADKLIRASRRPVLVINGSSIPES